MLHRQVMREEEALGLDSTQQTSLAMDLSHDFDTDQIDADQSSALASMTADAQQRSAEAALPLAEIVMLPG